MSTISLKRNFAWTIAGNTVLAAAQWGMVIALARLGSPELVGRYALALTITAPVILLCNLQLRVVQATDAHNRFAFHHFLKLRTLTCAGQVLLIASLARGLDYTSETFAVIVALGSVKVFEGLSDICFGLQQKHERMDSIAMSQILRGLVSLSVLAGLLAVSDSLLTAVLGMGAGWGLLLLFFDAPNARQLQRQANANPAPVPSPTSPWSLVPTLFRMSVPLGFVSMLISSFWTFPRYLLEADHGEATLGYFAVMAYFIVPVTTIVEALGQSAISRLARQYRSDPPGFRRLLFRLLAGAALLGTAGVAVAAVAGRSILAHFYGDDYAVHAGDFPLLMGVGGLIALCSVVGVALTAAGVFQIQLWILVVVQLVNVVAGLRLIPIQGIHGASLTVFIGATSWFLLAMAALVWIGRRTPVTSPSSPPLP